MRSFDALKLEWVECDSEGRVDDIPVFTFTIARKIRTMKVAEVAESFDIPLKEALRWKGVRVFLLLQDGRGSYKSDLLVGFEDEEGLERLSVSYKGLKLPPDALERLKQLEKKKGIPVN